MKTNRVTREWQGSGIARVMPARGGGVRDWQRWAPYAAVAWSLIYAALGVYWAVSGRGFPYAPETVSDYLGPVAGRFGPGVAWIVVIMAGIPAAAAGMAMLRGVRSRVLRPLLITAGALLAGILLLLMTDINLLILVGYTPYGIVKLLTGAEFGQVYLKMLTQWTVVHQLLCLIGGFLWLAATVSYARRSGDACLYCGRRDGLEGWTSPIKAARWGRIAVYVAMVVPVFYAVTRYAWALGIPLGMSQEYLRRGQESGMWISGLFLATFGLVGAVLMLGLVQRWGEVFPRWMIGLAGRRVPIALAVVPASIASVLLMVGGIAIWSSYAQMADAAVASGQDIRIVVGPAALFLVWGAALAVATLGYYYRRRGPCNVCGRGASDEYTRSIVGKEEAMNRRILITYATKHGSTKGIAEKIGQVLCGAGLTVDVLPVKGVHELAPYRAVIFGSAVYIGKWLKEAGAFLKANEKSLAERPVWLFSSGPTGEGDPVDLLDGWRLPSDQQPIVDRIHPRNIVVFHGDINQDKVNPIEKWAVKSLVKKPFGDFRDWDVIIAWATSIADALKTTEGLPSPTH